MIIIPKEMETLDKVERLEKEVERLRSVEVEVANNFDQQCLAFHNNLQNKGTSLTEISIAVILTLISVLENRHRCGPDWEGRRKRWPGLSRWSVRDIRDVFSTYICSSRNFDMIVCTWPTLESTKILSASLVNNSRSTNIWADDWWDICDRHLRVYKYSVTHSLECLSLISFQENNKKWWSRPWLDFFRSQHRSRFVR